MRLYELTESLGDLSPSSHGTNYPNYNDEKFSEFNGHVYTIFELSGMYFLVAVSAKGGVTFGTTEKGEGEPKLTDFGDDMKSFTGNIMKAFNKVIAISFTIISGFFPRTKTFMIVGKDERRAKLYQRLLNHPNIASEMENRRLSLAGIIKGNIYLERI